VVPFILFNQQVVTGHSLQPMHYEQFVVPYLILIVGTLTVLLSSNYHGQRRSYAIVCGISSVQGRYFTKVICTSESAIALIPGHSSTPQRKLQRVFSMFSGRGDAWPNSYHNHQCSRARQVIHARSGYLTGS
jgi:hypothetical protein